MNVRNWSKNTTLRLYITVEMRFCDIWQMTECPVNLFSCLRTHFIITTPKLFEMVLKCTTKMCSCRSLELEKAVVSCWIVKSSVV